MKPTLEQARRIELALRGGDLYEEASPQAIEDRERVKELYQTFKRKHSFSWSLRVASIIFICEVLEIEFDPNTEKDTPF